MTLPVADRRAVEERYARYLQACNDRRFDELEQFVADGVAVNGVRTDARRYAAGLADVIALVPDFRWELQRLLVDGDWLSALLLDTGTRADGRHVRFHELAVYRLTGGRIAEVWGDLDASRLGGG